MKAVGKIRGRAMRLQVAVTTSDVEQVSRMAFRDAVLCDLVREFGLYGVPHEAVVEALEVAFDTGAYYAEQTVND